MNSYDIIKKFENMLHLKHCLNYHPAMNRKAFAAIMFLDGNRVNSKAIMLPVYSIVNPCRN